MNPSHARTDLERLADDTVKHLVESGEFANYSGTLPPYAHDQLRQLKLPGNDERLLEDIFAERMIAATRNPYVEEITDHDITDKVLEPSHEHPVMVDIYTTLCRPCNHVLPVVYQLAEKYQDQLKVRKINAAKNAGFVAAFLGPLQVTPAFLFFKNGQPLKSSGRLARLLGQNAQSSSTRADLERRILLVLRDREK